MKAIVTKWYGGEDRLVLKEVPTPTFNKNEILIRICAASINPIDWKIRSGKMAFMTGLAPPKILGADFAGVVEGVGDTVSEYNVGDRVWGKVNSFKGGTYAQFISVKPNDISLMPSNLNFEEAAALPNVGLTAYQGLVGIGHITAGMRVLINGGSGGVGSAAVQLAKALDSDVTAVCSQKNTPLAKELGASRVVDYQTEKLTRDIGLFDIIFDSVATLSFPSVAGLLKPNGKYISTVPSPVDLFLNPVFQMLQKKSAVSFLVKPNHEHLLVLKELVESGKLKPVIEQTFPLDQAAQAHSKSQGGHVIGKLVLSVS